MFPWLLSTQVDLFPNSRQDKSFGCQKGMQNAVQWAAGALSESLSPQTFSRRFGNNVTNETSMSFRSDSGDSTPPRPGMFATVRNRRGVISAVEQSDGETRRLSARMLIDELTQNSYKITSLGEQQQ